MELTESVRSFQVPATPCTSAWPPSLPSVPTSRATRVTSDAKERSWSTMVLMVFLSSRISPFTSTVIFLDRSPAATAVVTSAMLRTCAVRLEPMELTESVRSFQVPATPCTSAWPPSLPSVPTSRATRVTSAEKVPSCSTILLMIIAVRKNSPSSARPSASSAMLFERSPCATAPITRATSLVGCTRSAMSELMLSAESRQKPLALGTRARSLSLPSLPTTRLSRASSSAIRTFSATTSLKASASLPGRPVQSIGRPARLSPFFKATSAARKTLFCSAAASVSASAASMAIRLSRQKPVKRTSSDRAVALLREDFRVLSVFNLSEVATLTSVSRLNSAAILPYRPSHSVGKATLASPRRSALRAFNTVLSSASRSTKGNLAKASMAVPLNNW